MKKKLVKLIIGVVNICFVFIYAVSLAYGKLPAIEEKPIFIQFAPLVVSFVIAIICEDRGKGEE